MKYSLLYLYKVIKYVEHYKNIWNDIPSVSLTAKRKETTINKSFKKAWIKLKELGWFLLVCKHCRKLKKLYLFLLKY